jgi:hypothetical protein
MRNENPVCYAVNLVRKNKNQVAGLTVLRAVRKCASLDKIKTKM